MTDYTKQLVEQRRELHQWPEEGWTEFWTTNYIVTKLRSWGYEVLLGTKIINPEQVFGRNEKLVQEGIKNALARGVSQSFIDETEGYTGCVALLDTGKEGPTTAFRFDIDCVCVNETDNPEHKPNKEGFRSQHAGFMHACGHDFHISTVLGSAYLLKAQEKDLAGTVYLIFQPAEEAPGGARKVMETGVLKEVQAIFGLHTSPLYDVGTLGIRAGAVTASVDKFTVTFCGKGTHAAHPERGTDPIVMAASFVTAAQSIVSRNIDPAHPSLISITHIESGNTWNVIPESAWLEGTVRCLTAEDRKRIKQRIYELAEGQAASFGGHAELTWYAGPPATNNTPDWTDFAIQVAEASGLTVEPAPVNLAGEDFAYYQEEIPGAFVLVGTGKSPANHNPKFHVDLAALGPAAKYMARLAKEAFARL